MRMFVMILCLAAVAAPAAAIEIPFRDGSVVEAVSYTVTGSYVMLEMPGGGKVAYDVADIDLDALRETEAALAPAAPDAEPADDGPKTLGVTGALTVPPDDASRESGGLTITDQHVKHVRGSGIQGPEDESEAEPETAEVPDDVQVGGGLVLQGLSATALEDGQWEIKGEVVNRTAEPALDVKVNLQIPVGEGDPLTASVPVSSMLGSDEKAEFRHGFATPANAAEGWRPSAQASVVWMKSETRLEPQYNRTAPHPSALPLDRGGVGGADTRDDVPF